MRRASRGAVTRAVFDDLDPIGMAGSVPTRAPARKVRSETASGRAHIGESGRLRGGGSHAGCAVYHDRYQRTADGWEFTERVHEIRYLDNLA
ncbi:nuclear transport factor 2 family protein [Nocardia brevicatena]|uniref:nuclear transport factor 2 family protein n=1 Tax=Nocardia brevicatena TaxID=37327 RepID=UPI001576E55F|nr:nuclear transport factor 2 family protein [Nocardia brevicatena]